MKERNPGRKLDDAFTALLSFIADPVIVLDDAGSVLATNQVVENTIGIKTADIIGKDFFEQNVFDEKQTLFIRENMRQRLSGVNIEPYEVTLNDKNGKSILLEVNAKKVEYAGQVLDFVVFRDVTERTQRQRILQRDLCNSELRFKTISDSTFDSIVLFDSKEKIRYWNPAAEKMFGYEKTEVLGKTLRETIVPSHAFPQLDKIREEFSKNLEETKGVIELLGLKKDGSEFPVEISISSLQVGEERLAVIMFRDITERKNAEYAWKQQHEMLETVTDNTGVGLMLVDGNWQAFDLRTWEPLGSFQDPGFRRLDPAARRLYAWRGSTLTVVSYGG